VRDPVVDRSIVFFREEERGSAHGGRPMNLKAYDGKETVAVSSQ
jgi:hypothetical protein